MNTNFVFLKSELRQELRQRLKLLTPEHRQSASRQACMLLRQQAPWQKAESILFYSPILGELDISSLLHESLSRGKRVALPRFIPEDGAYAAFEVLEPGRDCVPGKYGILEPGTNCTPMPLNQLDLVLVPGVGFDPAGHRLGRGKGYYDRLLAQVGGIKCGIAFDEQIVRRIPAEAHDVRLNCILTPTRWMQIAV